MKWIAAVVPWILGCASAPYDTGQLVQRFPELERDQARALAQATPYLLPRSGSLIWLTCRFDTEVPIPVSVAGATEAEEESVARALQVLERTLPAVRFLRVPPEEAAIHLEFVEGRVSSEAGEQTANTVANCRVDAPGAMAGEEIPAQLSFASVHVGRQGVEDALGRARPLATEELLGTLLHELGHALGFQGHVASGSTMVRNRERLRREGGKALAGELRADPALAALYALPSGTVLARVPVSPARTQLVDRMARLVASRDVAGPFLRVGDQSARIFWRDARGIEYGLQVGEIRRVLRKPGGIVVLPEARTRRALPRSRDVPLE